MRYICAIFCLFVFSAPALCASSKFIFSNNISSDTRFLPSGYNGDDIGSVYKRLAAFGGKKGEFEKTNDFSTRVDSEIGRVYAFCQNLSEPEKNVYFKYDADTEIVTIEPHATSRYIRGTHDTNVVLKIVSNSNEGDGYIGENGFGVKSVVRSFHDVEYSVCATNIPYGYRVDTSITKTPVVRFKMRPEDARILKEDYAFLIVARPILNNGELTYSEKEYATPTTGNPCEIIIEKYAINMKVLGVWIYYKRSGRVLFKRFLDEL